jgi:phytoene dehydrogenase-like protein
MLPLPLRSPAREAYAHPVPDAVIVGSGPNGLSAAVLLAQAGCSVLVLEAEEEIGGGTRTAELTLPGFRHDVCSAAHPLGVLSPFLSSLPLARYGLEWVKPKASVAHPLEEGAALLFRSLDETAATLLEGGDAYRKLMAPLAAQGRELVADLLSMPVPRSPLRLARFGLAAVRSAKGLADKRLVGSRARALLAGCAAHGMMPLEMPVSAAVGLLFLVAGHVEEWPVARGGSSAIASALAACLRDLGGVIETRRRVRSPRDLPPARAFLFDTSPHALADIAEAALPRLYVRRLRSLGHGPAAFKLDWALDGPIPWKDPACLLAATVHVGGTLEEIAASESAAYRGVKGPPPFVLVVQQSQFDPSRVTHGKNTGYAYCHVPKGSTLDYTADIEAQIERFAPGFRSRILARHVMAPRDLERHDANLVGGAIGGGFVDVLQTVLRARRDPYLTPNPRVFLCSASTPPGAGAHGMCGARAARHALRLLQRQPCAPLA